MESEHLTMRWSKRRTAVRSTFEWLPHFRCERRALSSAVAYDATHLSLLLASEYVCGGMIIGLLLNVVIARHATDDLLLTHPQGASEQI